MIYHTGVAVHNTEYYYAGAGSGDGIQTQKPKKEVGPWEFQESLEVCRIDTRQGEVRRLLNKMRPKWKANTYHLTSKNCNHFSDAFVQELSDGAAKIPTWVNRAARIG